SSNFGHCCVRERQRGECACRDSILMIHAAAQALHGASVAAGEPARRKDFFLGGGGIQFLASGGSPPGFTNSKRLTDRSVRMKGTMRTRNWLVLASLLLLGLIASRPAHAQTKLLRFPDVHGDKLVFTYGGDLWTAATSGGLAIRLTSHPGLELFAKFSPDGNW